MKLFLVQMTMVACGLFFTPGLNAQDQATQKKAVEQPSTKDVTADEKVADKKVADQRTADEKAGNEKDEPATIGPVLKARFSEGNTAYKTLFLYAEVELKSVYVWLNWQWVKAEKEAYPHPGKTYHLYRVSQQLAPTDGSKLLVNSWNLAGERTYRHAMTIGKTDALFTCSFEFESERSREEYLADKVESDKRFNDPYGFISLVNHYRSTRGLRPLVHDASLSHDASVNNSMGSPHAFMGRARVQNWAAGYANAVGALRAWQNSPGHNRNLLNPGITRGGISFNGSEWTFNGS